MKPKDSKRNRNQTVSGYFWQSTTLVEDDHIVRKTFGHLKDLLWYLSLQHQQELCLQFFTPSNHMVFLILFTRTQGKTAVVSHSLKTLGIRSLMSFVPLLVCTICTVLVFGMLSACEKEHAHVSHERNMPKPCTQKEINRVILTAGDCLPIFFKNLLHEYQTECCNIKNAVNIS